MRVRPRPACWRDTRAAAIAAVLLLSLGIAAHADRIDDLKASGQVGERLDGYLGVVVSEAPEEVRRFVDSVNQQRATEYQSIAARRGTTPAVVSALAGAKLVEREPAGHYVMDTAGNWVRKE